MSLRQEYMERYPDFPWLEAGDVPAVQEFLRNYTWLQPGETLEACDKAGEGNMNLTLRLETNERSMILKQARPWVEKYDHIAAPWDRMLVEQQFYKRVADLPEVARYMPRLLGVDAEARVILIEDLENSTDYTDLYTNGSLPEEDIVQLAAFLARLHDATRRQFDEAFANRDMRALNHEHIFVVPLDEHNGLDLDGYEPRLNDVPKVLREDADYMKGLSETAERYLADGPCLLHGDYFPGSWLRTPAGPKIIDPEFGFYGYPEFDLAICAAHLALSRQPRRCLEKFLDAYGADGRDFNIRWLARFAAAEVMRRLLGVAQLPIPPTETFRREIVTRSRDAMVSGDVGRLWS